jgi:hypothetical protein
MGDMTGEAFLEELAQLLFRGGCESGSVLGTAGLSSSQVWVDCS